VGGAGRGAAAMRVLAEAGYEVTAGVLHDTDTDAAVAERMNLERLTVPAFSTIDRATERQAGNMMRRASLVVVCDAPYGPGNVANLRAAVEAAEAGAAVVLLDRVPVGERDFTGGEATGLWERLRASGSVAGSPEELSSLVGSGP
ncbi:MAG: vitamin B12 ABC transporter ATP-binding protein BtuD, partial [Actinomycetota bacterium]|nr:vitamin B12 ABC transporter ATP-binding protein BtuD [Actinomycetota bacterium]